MGEGSKRVRVGLCRVKYFSEGLVLGSRDFVESAFVEKREWFSESRKKGARGIQMSGEGLYSMR